MRFYVCVVMAAACALAPLLPVTEQWWLVRLLVVVAAALVAAIALARSAKSRRAALVATAPLLPPVAAVCAVTMFLIRPTPYMVPIAGSVLAVLLWLLAAELCAGFPTVEHCNQSTYGELHQRLTQLAARLDEAEEMVRLQTDPTTKATMKTACEQALKQREEILRELGGNDGLPWVLATGYINVWKRLHRAEEATIEVLPASTVIAGALYDELRLSGSQVSNREELLAKLRHAVFALDQSAKGFLRLSADESQALATPAAPPMARAVLRMVRRALNEYRDDSYDGLVRSRNLTWGTAVITGAIAYMAMALAMAVGTSRAPIVAGATFYLVGAMVGLLARLRRESEEAGDVADYGLSTARLLSTPLLCGLAGIGGVILVATLPFVTSEFSPMRDVGSRPPAASSTPAAAPAAANATREKPPVADGKTLIAAGLPEPCNSILAACCGLVSDSQTPASTPSGALKTAQDKTAPRTGPRKTGVTGGPPPALTDSMMAACRELVSKASVGQPGVQDKSVAPGGTDKTPVPATPPPPAGGQSVAASPGASETKPATGGRFPRLVDVFDLQGLLLGVLVAAVFGLTPGLLFNRLQQQAEKYKAEIKTSEASQKSIRT